MAVPHDWDLELRRMNQCKRVSSLKFLAGRAIQPLSAKDIRIFIFVVVVYTWTRVAFFSLLFFENSITCLSRSKAKEDSVSLRRRKIPTAKPSLKTTSLTSQALFQQRPIQFDADWMNSSFKVHFMISVLTLVLIFIEEIEPCQFEIQNSSVASSMKFSSKFGSRALSIRHSCMF